MNPHTRALLFFALWNIRNAKSDIDRTSYLSYARGIVAGLCVQDIITPTETLALDYLADNARTHGMEAAK